MKHTYFLNGKAVDGKIAVKLFDPASPGIFETVRVYNGKIFREEEHLARLRESAQTVGLANELDLKSARHAIRLAVKTYGEKEAAVRVTWGLSMGLLVMVGQRRLPQELYGTGVALKTSCVQRSLSHASPPEAKTTDYMNALMATLEPKANEIYEWVFLDYQGFVTEVRTGNLFIVVYRGKIPHLKTPPLHGILNGVTRRFVIECALLQGVEVLEEPLTRHEVYNAGEAFLTNTSWEILPVRSLDGRMIGRRQCAGTGKALENLMFSSPGRVIPGQITKRLHQFFKKRVMRECPPSK